MTMYKRVKIKKGDTVKVISGGNKGKTGTVMQVLRKDDRVLVESVNIVTKHVKPSPTNPQGGIEKKEAPIHISNVMLVDGSGNTTRVGRRRGDDGKLVRYSKKSDQTLN
jgi:large subunit ribosomal protein L24